jgi:hypothetical protein
MKKLIFTLSLIGLVATGAFAQVSVGIKGGLNIANQKYSAEGFSISPDALIGFHIGGYVNIAPSEKFSIQPELLFSTAGSKFDFDGASTETKLSYITIPVMLKFNPAPIFNIHAGPQFGFLMSAKQDDEDIKDGLKGLDLGIGAGIGVDLPMGLNFTARYVAGLSNIADTDDDGIEVKNNVIQISIGYRLMGGE